MISRVGSLQKILSKTLLNVKRWPKILYITLFFFRVLNTITLLVFGFQCFITDTETRFFIWQFKWLSATKLHLQLLQTSECDVKSTFGQLVTGIKKYTKQSGPRKQGTLPIAVLKQCLRVAISFLRSFNFLKSVWLLNLLILNKHPIFEASLTNTPGSTLFSQLHWCAAPPVLLWFLHEPLRLLKFFGLRGCSSE